MTSNTHVAYRIGSEYAGDRETETFHNATDAEAIAALRGNHDQGYHKGEPVYVVRVYAETHTVENTRPGKQDVTYKAGEPVFGEKVTVYAQGLGYGAPEAAKVAYHGNTGTPDDMVAYMELMARAGGLANAANQLPCRTCAAEHAEREAAWAARKDAS